MGGRDGHRLCGRLPLDGAATLPSFILKVTRPCPFSDCPAAGHSHRQVALGSLCVSEEHGVSLGHSVCGVCRAAGQPAHAGRDGVRRQVAAIHKSHKETGRPTVCFHTVYATKYFDRHNSVLTLGPNSGASHGRARFAVCESEVLTAPWGGGGGRTRRPGCRPRGPADLSPLPSAPSQQRSKSEMLSRKNFAAGVPAVSMDELAAFADSYGARARRADGDSHEARAGGRFERPEAHALGGFYPDDSPEEYYGPRSRGREPLGDAGRAWAPSPPPRRRPDDAPLPRLVSRTPGAAPKYEHAPRAAGLERQARPEGASRGGSLETPSRLSAQLGRRSASYYAWSPPGTYKAASPQSGDDDDDDDDSADDALPPYSELELSRGPSYRGRDLPYPSNSEKRRKKEPAKKP
ncbi:immunoglobulin-like domain-containing receptor 2, partial [Hyaena hyaena]|uniref:immunoglobulin-like domain-containing receptor 2 n=1 Tax=Hyaena hyaena TaxID=95912 RepID=UPI001920CEF2